MLGLGRGLGASPPGASEISEITEMVSSAQMLEMRRNDNSNLLLLSLLLSLLFSVAVFLLLLRAL